MINRIVAGLCFFPAWLLSQSPVLDAAKADVARLTSVEMAGRGYQDDGHVKAALYIRDRLAAAGLRPLPSRSSVPDPWLQSFSFTLNRIDSASLKLNGKYLQEGRDFIPMPNSPVKSVSGRVVDGKYGLPGEVPKGNFSIVLMRHGLPPKIAADEKEKQNYADVSSDAVKINQAAMNGTGAVILSQSKLTSGLSRSRSDMPVVLVTDEALPRKVRTADIQLFGSFGKIQSQNVMGWVEGKTWPDSFIVVSAHYDHLGKLGRAVFTGANDNASGTSMLLSLAAHYARPENRPDCSMLFIAFGAEECGLIGSMHYVEKDPVVPLRKMRFILNLDLMGNGDQGITAVGGLDFPARFDRLKQLNDSLQAVTAVNGRSNAPNSDHYFFLKNGVPGFFIYTLGGPPHYHDIQDKAENLLYSRYEEVRKLLIAFLDDTGR